MISYDEALERLLAAIDPLASEQVAIDLAMGRILSEPVTAALNAPRADVSAMDGFAVRKAEALTCSALKIVGEAVAGAPFDGSLGPDQAVRIYTGAYVPDGADFVAIQELAEIENGTVRFADGIGSGSNIRTAGSDFRAGDTLLEAGTRLSPAAMVALAGADRPSVQVVRRPKIAVIATGDELVSPGFAAGTTAALPESASYGVCALATERGAHIVSRHRARDDLAELQSIAANALDQADCVVVIGGASVGDRDLAKPMFARSALDLVFSKVAIKPGKPVWFGIALGRPVLGLPGNPSSAMVTARLFLAPLLGGLLGRNGWTEVATFPLPLAIDLPANGSRDTFVRARLEPEGLLPCANQESGAQAPLATSDWLIRRGAGDPPQARGELVVAMPL